MKKWSIVVVILAVLVFTAIELYVQSDAFSARIRPFVVGPVKEVLGPNTRIGFVKANFFPPYLEVRDIVIPGTGTGPAATIRKITVYINPLPLLFRKIRLPSISILEPRVSVERLSGGDLNIKPLIERIRSIMERSRGGTPRYSLLLRTITVRKGELRFKDEAFSAEASMTGLNMTARFNLASDRVGLSVRQAQVRIAAPAYPAVTGEFSASGEYNNGRLRVNSVELAAGDFVATVSGEVGSLPDAVLDLRGRLQSGPKMLGTLTDFFKPVPRSRRSHVEASVVIRGKVAAPQIDGTISLSGLSYRGVTLQKASLEFRYSDGICAVTGDRWVVRGGRKDVSVDRIASSIEYRRGVLQIERFELTAGDLDARMQGTIDPQNGFNAHVTAESSGGRTLQFLTSLPVDGAVHLEGRLNGALNAPVFDGSFAAGPLTVRGVRFDVVNGTVEVDRKEIRLSAVNIRRGVSRYLLEGMVDFPSGKPVYDARVQVSQSDVASVVALFYKPLPLHIAASGELSFHGSAGDYGGSGFLSLQAGSAYGESFTRGAVTVSLSTGKISFPQVVVYKKSGMIKAHGWIGFNGTYDARAEGRDINVTDIDRLFPLPVAGTSEFELRSSGSFSHPLVAGTAAVTDFTVRGIALGKLHGAVGLQNRQLSIAAGLPEDSAHLSVLWHLRKPYPWSGVVKIGTDNINPLVLFGKSDAGMKMILDGAVSVHGTGLSLSSVSGEAIFPRFGIVMGEYRIDNESPARIDIDRGRLAVKSLTFKGAGTSLNITGSVKILDNINVAAKGTANLSVLKLLSGEVEHAAGTTEMQLTVKDGWSSPVVAGELQIKGGEIKARDIPQKFTALNGRIVFSQGRIVTESLSAEMGGGILRASGWAQTSGFSLREFSAKTDVDNVTVRYPEGLTSNLSGALYYDGDAKTQTLSGDITINRARYDKRIEWKSMLVDIGRGLYQKKKTDVGWIGDTLINVRFHGADNIVFQNNLAKMPLDMDVFLRGTVNHPQMLGRVEARKGSVFFRKNDFRILHASADFIDPNRMNPVLDIQAETQVREYQIRLAVTGTAERASVSFISDPPLNDTDILSLLALGKKGSELKGKETNIGVGEAASFATGQFQDIFERRARSLTGLDRFQVDPYVGKSDTSVPRVTVGKELIQNRLYVTYSSNVGAAIPEQIFRIEYILDRHFSIVGERNELGNSGADIKYRFEFR